jgi:hypothetical protein
MAIEKIIDIKVQGNAEQAVGSLRSQLRQAQADVAALSDKFGATSDQAVIAAKKAGELKDKIADAKALTDAFNPDAKFKALTSSLSGVASGFGAVQGAIGLMGVQSSEVEATLLKVQSAMALSQGLQALGEAKDSFRQLGAVANDVFKTIKAAIGSTGIGLFVIALAGIVTYWDEIAVAVTGATEETKAYNEAQTEVNSTIAKTEESLISVKISIDNAKKGIISKSEALKLYNEKLGEAFGKTDDLDIAEKRMAENTGRYIQAQIARATAQSFVAKAAEAAANAASGKDMDLTFWDKAKIALLGYGSIGTTIGDKIIKNQKDISFYQNLAVKETEKADKLTTEIGASGINKRYDANKKAQEDALKNQKTNEEKLKELRDENTKNLKNLDETQIVEELQNIDAKNQAKRDKDQKFQEDTLAAQEQFGLQIAETIYSTDQAIQDREMALNEEKLQNKRDYYDAATGFVQDGQDLMQKIEDAGIGRSKATMAIQKGLALALIGIDSARAFSTAVPMAIKAGKEAAELAGPAAPLAGPIATAASYASSALMIIGNMNKARKLLGGGGGGTAPSMSSASSGGGGATAPQFNVVGNTGVNQLAATLGREQPPIKAYVTAGDVTSGQSLNRNIITNASLG